MSRATRPSPDPVRVRSDRARDSFRERLPATVQLVGPGLHAVDTGGTPMRWKSVLSGFPKTGLDGRRADLVLSWGVLWLSRGRVNLANPSDSAWLVVFLVKAFGRITRQSTPGSTPTRKRALSSSGLRSRQFSGIARMLRKSGRVGGALRAHQSESRFDCDCEREHRLLRLLVVCASW